MVKPDAKAILALAGVALAVASAAAIFLMALQGSPQWVQLLVFVVAAVFGFASALLFWMLGARQVRVERSRITKTILDGLATIEADSKRDIADLREGVGVVRDQNDALAERQRKMLNVVRSEASAERGRLDALIEAQKVQDDSIGEMQRALIGVGSLRDDLGALHALVETEIRSGTEFAGEIRDGLKELRALARKVVNGVDVVDSRDRKILNLLRGEIRDSAARSEDVKRALAVEGRNAGKAAAAVDEASTTVRKMHNFLRREGSIQVAVDRFTAAERRMLAAVEVAGLDHADQIASLKSTIDVDRESESSERSRLRSDLSTGIEQLRVELDSSLGGLVADLHGLRDLVAGGAASESRILGALTSESDQLSANFDVRLKGLDDKLVHLGALVDEMGYSPVVESGSSANASESVVASVPPSLPELTQAYDSVSKAVARVQTGRLERFMKRQSIDVTRQVEALMQLVPRVESQLRRYPPSGWWALPADTLLFLSDYIEQERPQRILEIGSGSSTVWTGTFAKNAGAELVSLEHDADYVQKTRALVDEFGLQDVVTLHHAPLKPVELEEGTFDWYDPNVISSLGGTFDVLIVDGPPEATGPKARMPALPMLEHLLAEKCLILLDDTHRPDEQEILQAWIERFSDFEVLPGDLMRTGLAARKGGASPLLQK